jgi:hypothetical protein
MDQGACASETGGRESGHEGQRLAVLLSPRAFPPYRCTAGAAVRASLKIAHKGIIEAWGIRRFPFRAIGHADVQDRVRGAAPGPEPEPELKPGAGVVPAAALADSQPAS